MLTGLVSLAAPAACPAPTTPARPVTAEAATSTHTNRQILTNPPPSTPASTIAAGDYPTARVAMREPVVRAGQTGRSRAQPGRTSPMRTRRPEEVWFVGLSAHEPRRS